MTRDDLDASIKAHHAYRLRCQQQLDRDDFMLTVKLTIAVLGIAALLVLAGSR